MSLEGRSLYVTNYELPEVRRRQQMENKDKADFFTQKKNSTPSLDASLLSRPDTLQMIHQVLQFLQKSMLMQGGRFPNQAGFNNQRQHQPRYPRDPRQQQVGARP